MQPARKKHSDADLSLWLKHCNPAEPVPPGTALHYPLDEGGHLRGDYDLANIIRPLELSGKNSCQLFTGFNGTGKSTELLQLKEQLVNRGYVVLLVDAEEYLSLSRPLEIEDLLVVLAGAFGDATDAVAPPANQVLQSAWAKLLGILKTEVELAEAGVSLGPLDLKFNVKHGNELWKEARKRLAMTPGRLESLAHSHVLECVGRLKRKFPKKRGVVFMVDSLEKLRGTVDQFLEVMNSAVRTFTDYSRELHLPDCHVIYTVPPYLPLLAPALAGHYDQISEILPAVKIESIASRMPMVLEPFRPGIEALSELVGRRVPLEVFFGDNRGPLETLILASGGHVRTLIAMVRDLIYRIDKVGSPVDEQDVAVIVNRFRERASLGIWEEHTLLLDRIRQEASVVGIRQEELPTVADFMDRQMVLCYRNGGGWYQVHPLVRAYVQERAAAYAALPPRTAGY